MLPLKGGPVGANWAAGAWLVAFVVNAAWGIGAGAFLRLLATR